VTDYKIATIPGDGIGTEVMAATVKVLEALAEKTGLRFEFSTLWAGDEHKARTGVALPPETSPPSETQPRRSYCPSVRAWAYTPICGQPRRTPVPRPSNPTWTS
jgi:isocitrate dehydrogenase